MLIRDTLAPGGNQKSEWETTDKVQAPQFSTPPVTDPHAIEGVSEDFEWPIKIQTHSELPLPCHGLDTGWIDNKIKTREVISV